jgi:hypothetical protein
MVFCLLASSRADQTRSWGLNGQLARRTNGVNVCVLVFRLGVRK